MEKRIVRRIQFTGKNLNDIFELPCTSNIIKLDNKPYLILHVQMARANHVAKVGNTLVEYDDGMWDIEK